MQGLEQQGLYLCSSVNSHGHAAVVKTAAINTDEVPSVLSIYTAFFLWCLTISWDF